MTRADFSVGLSAMPRACVSRVRSASTLFSTSSSCSTSCDWRTRPDAKRVSCWPIMPAWRACSTSSRRARRPARSILPVAVRTWMRSSAAVSGSAISTPTCETSSCQRSSSRDDRSDAAGRLDSGANAVGHERWLCSIRTSRGAHQATGRDGADDRPSTAWSATSATSRRQSAAASVCARLGRRQRPAGRLARRPRQSRECDNLFTLRAARRRSDRSPPRAMRRSPRASKPNSAEHRFGVGAEQRRRAAVADRRRRRASSGWRPAAPRRRRGCAISTVMSRARTCGSANTSARSLIGPHGTLAASSAVEPFGARLAASGARRAAAPARRGGARGRRCGRSARRRASSLQPATAQKRANWPSLPTARIRWPSATSNTWYGTMFWCALPARCGATPVAR